jgi:endoglucanase
MTRRVAALLLVGLTVAACSWAADDGSQLQSPFRVNYLGYFQHGPKIALHVSAEGGALAWSLKDAAGKAVASGTSRDHVSADFASGDSFFRIDFSSFTGTGTGFRLSAGGKESEPFDVAATGPYGRLAEESFDYFKDHRAPETVFEKFLHDWTTGRVVGPFWYDAGDKGSYPTNTAMAAWLLMNLYERYPESRASLGKTTLYEELKVGTALMHQLILPGHKLAIAKLHTNVPTWGPCPPHETGPCVSKTETKATYAMARTLAQLSRVHLAEKQTEAARSAFALARTAFTNARTEPHLCRDFPDFGGEGGIYPDNDVYALWREPAGKREPCHPGRDNIEDDAYSALVEVFLASRALSDPGAADVAKEVVVHPRFGEIGEFWWMSVAPTANLSLLALRPEGIDLEPIRKGLFAYADACAKHAGVGYPGVTKDAKSDRWDSGDKDEVDNNWRWGSSRLLLDDAVVLAYAAEEKARVGERKAAAAYAGHAVRVMDWILGTNAMALSMVTGFGEHAVERLHDTIVPDTEPGKMALGPNNWTNAGDPDMPPFGSLPGMKMMPVKGRGWAAREIAIDGNAPLVWMAWWSEHQAAALLAP